MMKTGGYGIDWHPDNMLPSFQYYYETDWDPNMGVGDGCGGFVYTGGVGEDFEWTQAEYRGIGISKTDGFLFLIWEANGMCWGVPALRIKTISKRPPLNWKGNG